MNSSILNQQTLQSPLSQQTLIDKSKDGNTKRVLTATLVLTSLVDAFSILVIYLLINTSSATETLDISKTMNLPKADNTQVLDSAVVVRVDGDKYIINEKTIGADELVNALTEAAKDDLKKGKLIIQANQDVEFDSLNPIFSAGAHAGFENIKFAVWPNNESPASSDQLAAQGRNAQ